MVARSGLFVDPVAGTPPVGASMADGRRVLGALFGTTFRAVSGGTLSASGSTMAITVAQSVWAIPDVLDASSSFISPTDQTVVTPAAGPGTGSRIDLILVKQNNVSGGDTDSRASVYLKAGTPGASPVAPTPDVGSQIVATITVPTNASNAAACTIAPASALTGWIPFNVGNNGYPSGFSNGGNGWPPSYQVQGNTVLLSGAFAKSAGGTFASGESLWTFPAAIVPPSGVIAYYMSDGNGATSGSLQLTGGTGLLQVHSLKASAGPLWLSLEGWSYRLR